MIRFCSIGKRFPGVVALEGVSFALRPGTCHALMGENGAGKSTLGKILAGIYVPDEGHIELRGEERRFRSPLDAQRAGIGIVHQEPAFCRNLSVAENLCLSALPHRGPLLDRPVLRTKALHYLDTVGVDVDPDQELERLSTAQIQLVQIASALATGANVIIMDEPTSSLSVREAERLHDLIGRLRSDGTTILYVSHRMDEVFKVCDAVTILRDGRHVGTLPLAETTQDALVRMMIGRQIDTYFRRVGETAAGQELLRVENLTSPGKFRNVSFSLFAGEVLGLAGLVGAGRSELAHGIFGLDPETRGRIWVRGIPVTIHSPRQAMELGIGLVPEDRKKQGLVLTRSCGENVTLASLDRLGRCGFLRTRPERAMVAEYFQRLGVRAPHGGVPAAGLSGGNQQKLVIARWLARHCSILILDEPTRGIDVGAKAEIHALVRDLAAAGHGVLLISSELPEILNLSTRMLVLRDGRTAGVLDREGASQEGLMQLMAGIKPPPATASAGGYAA